MVVGVDHCRSRVTRVFRSFGTEYRNEMIEKKVQNGLYAHQNRDEIIQSVAGHWPMLRELNFMKGRELRDSLSVMNRSLEQIGFEPVSMEELVGGIMNRGGGGLNEY